MSTYIMGLHTKKHQRSFTCKYGTVMISYEIDYDALQEAFGPDFDCEKLLKQKGPEALPFITTAFQIEILSRDRRHKIGARFEAWEAANLFQEEWPNDRTFSYISQTVRDRRD